MKRRDFIAHSAALTGGIMLSSGALLHAGRRISANDKIQVGVIGCNSMGWVNADSFLKMPEIDVTAICDVDNSVIQKRLADYEQLRKNKPKTYSDYRELLNDKDVDAVIIGTPDHWHCKIMVDAVKAGKHVYVEKPIANSIEECKLMVAAQEKTGKIVQVGQWQRSGPHYQKAIEMVRSGALGKIRTVKVWSYQRSVRSFLPVPDSKAPEGVDYNFWLGPAPMRDFNANRFHFKFRWFWDYAGGLMTDWGVHEIDIALYAMQPKAPLSVSASGGKMAFPESAAETPDTLQVLYEFEDFIMLWEHAAGISNGPYQRKEGIAFVGSESTLVVNREGYELITERAAKEGGEETPEPYRKPWRLSYVDLHTKNFIEAIIKNDPAHLNTPIKAGSAAAVHALMGNIAYRTGHKLFWDAGREQFVDHEAANKLTRAVYHNGWKVPVV